MPTSDQRAAWGRIGAHRLHATHDSHEIAANARRGLMAKFEREVDPDGVLSPEERARRAEHARKAHMQRIALKSVAARKAKKSASTVPVAAAPTGLPSRHEGGGFQGGRTSDGAAPGRPAA